MPENMLDFQCPHCHAKHQLPLEFAGNRQPCSACGQTMRLPSLVGDTDHNQQNTTVNQAQSGSIMVTCPLCGKTLYASQQQGGQKILCETCLESIPVPVLDPTNTQNQSTLTKHSSHADHQERSVSPKPDSTPTAKSNPTYQENELKPELPPEAPPALADESSIEESGEFKLEPVAEKPSTTPLSIRSQKSSDDDLLPPSVTPLEAIPIQSGQSFNPDKAGEEDEEIIELEAIGEAPSIPVQPLPTSNIAPADKGGNVPVVEFELVVRWATPCPSCQAQLIVYQQDMGQTVQCSKCNQPVTVETRQSLPRPERVAKITHQYIGEQTRIAVLSKNQPQPKKETVYKTVVEWKLDCDVCGTGLTATPEDIGSQKRCPDCHKVHTIVAPTRMPAPVQRIVQDELEELNSPQTTGQQIVSTKQVLSEIPDMRDKIQRDEFAASRKILEKAQQQQNKRNEEEEKLQQQGNSWGNSLTQLVTSPTTLARITLLTIGYAITAALFSLSLNSMAGDSGSETKANNDTNTAVKSDLAEEFDFETSLKQPTSSIKAVGAILLFIAALAVFLFVNLAGLSTLMNILRQTIVGDLQISDWPPFSITGWASDAFTLFAAFIYSLIPSGIVFTLLDFILANSLIPTMLSSIAMVLLFPFFLLNILASGSVLLPISTTFIKKLKYQSDLLVKFLFFTTLAIITNIMGFNLLTSKSLLMAMIGGGLVWLGYVVLVRNVGFLVFNLTADDN